MSRPEAIRAALTEKRSDRVRQLGPTTLPPSSDALDAARVSFSVLAAMLDIAAILAVTLIVVETRAAVAGKVGASAPLASLGAVLALLFVTVAALRGEYRISRFLGVGGGTRRVAQVWLVAVVTTCLVGFLTGTLAGVAFADVSILFVACLPMLAAGRAGLARLARRGIRTGFLPARRLFLVGSAASIERFQKTWQPWNLGCVVVGIAVVSSARLVGAERAGADMAAQIDHAVLRARRLQPDDVFILAPWSHRSIIESCAAPFLALPVAIHLGPERILDRFEKLDVLRLGSLSTLTLSRRPLTAFEIIGKRLFDLVLASAALIVLAPLLAVIALLIRLDSPGPALFRQHRFGFNQRPFRILKFRSMHVIEDGAHFTQARADDPRITRLGKVLRRYNLDELPQLINVLRGEMSLVGPRPHALAHDRDFEDRIAFYARRHNVKPGITGWAQVNGHRGETSTLEKMERRVERDLEYIENWSLWFDIKIIVMTVISPKAYRNAA